MSVFLTIIAGVFVFIIGQIVLKLFVEPWQKQRECIALIGHSLILHANIYGNPGKGDKSVLNETSQELRKLAADLVTSCNRIPFYNILSKMKIFPNIVTVMEAKRNLIGLSNSIYQGDSIRNSQKADKVIDLLKLNMTE